MLIYVLKTSELFLQDKKHGVRISEQLGRHLDGDVLQWVWLKGKNLFKVVRRTWAEVGVGENLAEVDSGWYFRKLWMIGSEERMWKPSLRRHLSLGWPR